MPAIALDDDRTQVRYARKRIDRSQQALDELAVVGIVDLRPVENEGCDPALIDAPQHRSGRIRRAHRTSPKKSSRSKTKTYCGVSLLWHFSGETARMIAENTWKGP